MFTKLSICLLDPQVQYFNGIGKQGLKLEYKGPDTNDQTELVVGDSLCFESSKFSELALESSIYYLCFPACKIPRIKRCLCCYNPKAMIVMLLFRHYFCNHCMYVSNSVPSRASGRFKWRQRYRTVRWPKAGIDSRLGRDANARELLQR